MAIIEDTRNKADKHNKKHKYWLDHNQQLIRCALPYGDYTYPPRVSIDTKKGLTEIATNMCGNLRETARFREECKLAKDCGAKLIVLVECNNVQTKFDLYGKKIRLGSGRYIMGDQLAQAMNIVNARYGTEFEFCETDKSAKRITEILEQWQTEDT